MITGTSSLSWIVALLAFILGMLTLIFTPKIRKSLRVKMFLAVFGEVAAKHKNLVISIPLWNVMRAPRGTPRFIKETFDVAKDDEWYGPDKIVDFGDLEACLLISSLMHEFHSAPVPFTLDNYAPLSEIGANKTIFLIGPPHANLLTKTIFETKEEDGMSYFQPYFDYIGQSSDDGTEVNALLRDKQENRDYASTEDWDYGLVLRVPNMTNDGYFFVLSGFRDEGIYAAANFLKENWREFKDAESTAGVLLRMKLIKIRSSKHISGVQVVRSYGFAGSLALEPVDSDKKLIENWKTYLNQVTPQIRQGTQDYVYPIEEQNTVDREFIQDPNKMTTEQSEIIKSLKTDWQTAIDFGCGTGAHFQLFDQEGIEKRFLIGIDPDCPRANLARVNAEEFLKWIDSKVVCGGIEILEEAPSDLEIDRILCSQVLGHVSEEQLIRILRAFHQVLAPDGRCAILIPVIGETFKAHPNHTKEWNGIEDYTHIVNTTLSPTDPEFRTFVNVDEFTKQANNPVSDRLPVRSYLLPDFPDPATFQTPGLVSTIPPTIKRIIQNYFIVDEVVLYSIHRDTPTSNWPVADVIIFLRKHLR